MPPSEVRIVNIGDADIVHTDVEQNHDNTERTVRNILEAGANHVILGGDHSIHDPEMAAYSDEEPLYIVHFDAPLDFVDERHGERHGHGNSLRWSSEMTLGVPHDAARNSKCFVI